MGLECFAVKVVDAHPALFAEVPRGTEGGVHHGLGSQQPQGFYGSRYAAFVDRVTDGEISLYTPLLPVDEVKTLADALADWVAENPEASWTDPHKPDVVLTPSEIQALAQWFRTAADNDCRVESWW